MWSCVVTAAGNLEMADAVSETLGSIGFLTYPYAKLYTESSNMSAVVLRQASSKK